MPPRPGADYKWVMYGNPPRRVRCRDMSVLERAAAIAAIQLEVAEGRMSLAGAVKCLRVDVMGLTQSVFASIFKMSARAVSRIESEKLDPATNVYASIFRAFGMSLSLEMKNPISRADQLQARLAERRNSGGWRPDDLKLAGDLDVAAIELEQALLPFLKFLALDMEKNPQRLVTISDSLRTRAQELVEGIDIKLDACLPSDSDSEG